MEFKNGSEIKYISTSKFNCRSKRSEIISFWCDGCKTMHIEVPISEMMSISDNLVICKTNYEKILEPAEIFKKGE
jgi:uncharacterized protein YrrD